LGGIAAGDTGIIAAASQFAVSLPRPANAKRRRPIAVARAIVAAITAVVVGTIAGTTAAVATAVVAVTAAVVATVEK
jgi:hypothetical protein